jgi:hypothetical protein
MSFQNTIRSACVSAEQPACDSAEEMETPPSDGNTPESKGQEQVMTNNTFTHTKIENMKKILKSHRAALDFD